jgi:hypothetical protein
VNGVNLWPSFFAGGFESSTHVRRDGRRLDLLAATFHDRLAVGDYERLVEHSLLGARDAVRWHLIERRPGDFDWSTFRPMLNAADRAGISVTWDLCHYGLPDQLDIWSDEFPSSFARFCGAAARIAVQECGTAPSFCPINEISFWAWAGGEKAMFNPCLRGRGADLKRVLVRAALMGIAAIRDVIPDAIIICAEPMIRVAPSSGSPKHQRDAAAYHASQFEAVDMLLGRASPELGGHEGALDVIGVNYYPGNQWHLGGDTIPLGHYAYVPLSDLLSDWQRRYSKPLVLAETGAERSARASWLHYVCGEVAEARRSGIPVEGVCLYPILDYPGWENDRICSVGLFSCDQERTVHLPLARELRAQQKLLLQSTLPSQGAQQGHFYL